MAATRTCDWRLGVQPHLGVCVGNGSRAACLRVECTLFKRPCLLPAAVVFALGSLVVGHYLILFCAVAVFGLVPLNGQRLNQTYGWGTESGDAFGSGTVRSLPTLLSIPLISALFLPAGT
jgi:hypothetical protein